MKLSLLALAVFAFPFAVGCAVAPESEGASQQEANTARVTPGTFKLYAEPHALPDAFCDLHTRIVLTSQDGSKAHVEEALLGQCELAVFPRPHDYQLRHASSDCGSHVFTGTSVVGEDRWSIKITDNRTRICEDVFVASIIVEETHDGPQGRDVSTLFSPE